MARFNLVDLIEDEITATEERVNEGWIWGDRDIAYTQDEADDIRTKAWEKLQERVGYLIEDGVVGLADLTAAKNWLRANVTWIGNSEIDAAWAEDIADMTAPAPVLVAA